MSKLKNLIALTEMLLEALKDLQAFHKETPKKYLCPEKARVNRLRIELYKELIKFFKTN